MVCKNISITRGDSKTLILKVKDGNSTISDFDKVYFSVKKDCFTEDLILQKKLNSGITKNETTYEILIDASDTDNLEYGRYEYDIEVIKGSLKETVLGGVFTIEKEVTFVSNEV